MTNQKRKAEKSQPDDRSKTEDAALAAKPFAWRDHLAVHPAADLFPLMPEAELKELADDINKNGLQIPIVVGRKDDGGTYTLLDGRNRLDALALLGQLGPPVPPKPRERGERRRGPPPPLSIIDPDDGPCVVSHARFEITGSSSEADDDNSLVTSLNVHRRHLTADQKRELIATLIKADPEKSNRQIAEQVKASHPHIAKVRKELEKTGDVETVSTSIDTKGRKQPAKRKGKATASKSSPKRDAAPEPEPDSVTTPHVTGSAEVSAEQRRAEFAALDAGIRSDRAQMIPPTCRSRCSRRTLTTSLAISNRRLQRGSMNIPTWKATPEMC